MEGLVGCLDRFQTYSDQATYGLVGASEAGG